MIDFIIKLEDALTLAAVDYELIYLPEESAYVLKIDGTAAFIMSVKEETNDGKVQIL